MINFLHDRFVCPLIKGACNGPQTDEEDKLESETRRHNEQNKRQVSVCVV